MWLNTSKDEVSSLTLKLSLELKTSKAESRGIRTVRVSERKKPNYPVSSIFAALE